MAYIDVETRSADYRVIVTHHDQIVPPEQMPKSCSGLLLEAVERDPILLLTFISGRFQGFFRNANQKHYEMLLWHCMAHKIPVVIAEPVASEEAVLGTEFHPSDDDTPEEHRELVQDAKIRLALLAESIKQLPYPSPAFDAFAKLSDYVLMGRIKEPTHLRNLMIAQRGHVFAESRAEDSRNKPSIAIACGAAHLGHLVEAIEMDPQTRAEMINNHPLRDRMFNPPELNSIYYAEHSKEKNKWEFCGLTDTNLVK